MVLVGLYHSVYIIRYSGAFSVHEVELKTILSRNSTFYVEFLQVASRNLVPYLCNSFFYTSLRGRFFRINLFDVDMLEQTKTNYCVRDFSSSEK